MKLRLFPPQLILPLIGFPFVGLLISACTPEDQVGERLSTSEIVPSEWLNGINMPWIDFGNDFGGNPDSGAALERAFREFEKAGINSVRMWIHCDGRRNPVFDQPGGRVTGLPEGFLDDFEQMLDAAEEHGILVMPALWSFDMVKDRTHESGVYAGIQSRLLMEDDYLAGYIENALIPLLERCDPHPALYAWEICNEPEWMVESKDLTRIPVERVQRFHARLAAAIHEHGNKPVTTGSASIKWSTDELEDAEENWWSDAALQAAYPDPGAYFDFYQIHVYGWMLKHGFDPYIYTPEDLGLDKPVMLGEAPGKLMEGEDTNGNPLAYTPEQMLQAAREKGYFGHYFWSYAAYDGHGDWETIEAAVAGKAASSN